MKSLIAGASRARKLWFVILCGSIVIIALLTRVYRLPERYVFGADEEYQDTYARTIVNDFHPIWIGMNVGDTGAYHGPFFIYFTSLWLKLGRNDPLVTAYVAAIIGVITTASSLYIFSNWFGKRVALVSSFIYAMSPLMVFFDQKYWNPLPVPLIAIWLIYATSRLKEKPIWLLMIAASLGAIVNTHFSLFVLYPFVLGSVFVNRKYIPAHLWFGSLLIFGLAITPLVIFDYYHNYSNILTPFRMLQLSTGTNLNIAGNVKLLMSAFARFIYLMPGKSNADEVLAACRVYATNHGLWLSIIATSPFIAFLLNKKNWKNHFFLLLSMCVMALSFILYPRSVSEYYALGLIPFYFMSVAFLIVHMFHNRIIITLLILFAVGSTYTLFFTAEQYGLAAKKTLIEDTMNNIKDRPFYLDEAGIGCHKWEGWRYLFTIYGKYPVASTTDNSLGWLYPGEIIDDSHVLRVTVGNTGNFTIPSNAFSLFSTGAYTAVIE